MRHLVLAAVLLMSSLALAADAERSPGSTRVLVPAQGMVPFPEGIAVRGREVFVSGPATFGTAGSGPSDVRVFDVDTGALKRVLTIQGQVLSQEHALSCITFDGAGRLYVIDTQQGVLRLDPVTGAQETYAPPPPVLPGHVMALPNDLAFDDKGWLYVTDSVQGTIWRIAPGGGAMQPWFYAPQLATVPGVFGMNGLRLHPNGRELWFTHSVSESLYALPLVEAPRDADLRLVHRFTPGSGPDGFAFGASGRVYVTLALSHQLGALVPYNGRLYEVRVGGQAPWDAPANVAFAGNGSALVTNHAVYSANPGNFLVLDVAVYDTAARMAQPLVP